MTTPLYAYFTAETLAELAGQVAEFRRRDRIRPPDHQYTILPWALEDLPGTTWRNAWTMTWTIVQAIEANRFGKMGPDPDPWARGMFSLGLWRGERFCIEHWIRVDHLSPQAQVDFAAERVAWCRRERVQFLESLQDPRKAGSAAYQSIRLEGIEEQIRTAQHWLAVWAGRLGVDLHIPVVNVGAQPGEQLALL